MATVIENIEKLYQYRDNIADIIRVKGVDVPDKTKLKNLPPYIDMLEPPTPPVAPEEWSQEYFDNCVLEALTDYKVEISKYTGHVDEDGLREIGWTSEDIEYFKERGIDWMEEDDDKYLVSDYEKELYRTNAITTSNYTTTAINNNYDYVVEWRNNIRWFPKYTTSKLANGINFRSFHKVMGFPSFDFSNSTNLNNLFSHCYELRCIQPISTKPNAGWTGSNIFSYCNKLRIIDGIDFTYATTLSIGFRGCCSLIFIPELNLSNCTNISQLFYGCSNLKCIGNMVTSSKLTTATSLFYECSSLITIPAIDTSSILSLQDGFFGCQSLTCIPNLNVGKCNNFTGTFRMCSSIAKIPDMNFTNVTTYSGAFNYCTNLKQVPLTLDFSKCTNITNMFAFCEKIESFPYKLDLNTSATNPSDGIASFSYMITYSNIKEIYFGKLAKLNSGDHYVCQYSNFLKKIGVDDFMGSTYTFAGSVLENCEELVGELKGLRNNISFTSLPALNKESIMRIINALEDMSGTGTSPKLTIGTEKLRILTNDEKAIATNKGWVLA